jgi:hypothetical protein
MDGTTQLILRWKMMFQLQIHFFCWQMIVQNIISMQDSKDIFLRDVRMKLGIVRNVNPNDIVILGLSAGSITVSYLNGFSKVGNTQFESI